MNTSPDNTAFEFLEASEQYLKKSLQEVACLKEQPLEYKRILNFRSEQAVLQAWISLEDGPQGRSRLLASIIVQKILYEGAHPAFKTSILVQGKHQKELLLFLIRTKRQLLREAYRLSEMFKYYLFEHLGAEALVEGIPEQSKSRKEAMALISERVRDAFPPAAGVQEVSCVQDLRASSDAQGLSLKGSSEGPQGGSEKVVVAPQDTSLHEEQTKPEEAKDAP